MRGRLVAVCETCAESRASARRASPGRPDGPAILLAERDLVREEVLGWHKAPSHIRWFAAPRPVDARLRTGGLKNAAVVVDSPAGWWVGTHPCLFDLCDIVYRQARPRPTLGP